MVPTNRPLMEAVIKNMSWWRQAVQDIGWRAIFLAVSVAESDEDVNQRLAGFKSEQEFVDYISSILSALYDAKKDAQKLLALKENLRLTQAELDLYKIHADKLEEINSALQTIVTSLIRAVSPERRAEPRGLGNTAGLRDGSPKKPRRDEIVWQQGENLRGNRLTT